MSAQTEMGGARRMTSADRREQLSEAALDIVAEGGYEALTLDGVAERAGVTRNLIYHYFPRGRLDLMLAVVDIAGEELTRGWLIDDNVPVEERLAQNFQRFFEHALEPTRIWLAHREGRHVGEPEVKARGEEYRAIVIRAVALNNFGTEDAGPLAMSALRSFLDFGERALDECRERGLERDHVFSLLADALLAVVESVRKSAGSGSSTPATR